MHFQWKERYMLDLADIDTQHQKLFDIGSRIYYLTQANDDHDHYDEITSVLSELLHYTEYHFKYEEDLLKQHAYPELPAQTKEHAYYIEKINSIAARDIDDNQQGAIEEIVDFLSQWITSHIVFEDRKYAAYLKEKGVH